MTQKSSVLGTELMVTQAICQAIDSPRALTVDLLIRNGEWGQLAALECNPVNYQVASAFADDRLVTALLSKSTVLPLGVDREEVATAAFFTAETCCAETNQRLRNTDAVDHPSWWRRAFCLLDSWLPAVDDALLEEVVQSARHGPGAAVGVRGDGLVVSDKYDATPTLTTELVPFAPALMGPLWREYRSHVRVVRGNKFSTVPKNAKTDRGICTGAMLNVFLQLGIGTVLMTILKRLGIDLHSQERNQKLAARAHVDGLATIDLRQASDMLAQEVPKQLLPDRWYELLDLSREKETLVGNEWHALEKFCAMGNGFTFPLQTLLFWSVVCAIVPKPEWRDCGAYGDDLIVPQVYAVELVDALEYLGFSVNQRKSFLAGSFFESCGSEFFEGTPVRPFYLRAEKDDHVPYPMHIANQLRLWSSQRCSFLGCDSRFRGVWKELSKLVPDPWRRCKVPESFGDSGLLTSLGEACPRRAADGLEGYSTKIVVCQSVNTDKRSYGVVLNSLRTLEQRAYDGSGEDWLSRWAVMLEQGNPLLIELLKNTADLYRDPHVKSLGREPRRGYLRRIRVEDALAPSWGSGLDWL